MGIISKVQVKVQYSEMIRQAKKINALVSDCQQAQKALNDAVSEFSQAWQGEAADEAYNELLKMSAENAAIIVELRNQVSYLRKKAEAYREADRIR